MSGQWLENVKNDSRLTQPHVTGHEVTCVTGIWTHLGLDITHYGGQYYLTLIDVMQIFGHASTNH